MITFIMVIIGALIMLGPVIYALNYESKYTKIDNYYLSYKDTITVPKMPVIEKKSDVMVMDTDVSILEVIAQIESELDEEANPKIVEPKALPQPITYSKSVTKKCVCTPKYTCSACQFQSAYTKVQNELEERLRSTIGSKYMILSDDCELTYEYNMGSAEKNVYCVRCGQIDSRDSYLAHKRNLSTGYS